MSHNDREEKFQQALARHLRTAGSGTANEAFAEAGDDGAMTAESPCPDVEVLAALHERILSAEQLGRVQEHIAACGRCQEILGLLKSGDAVELQAPGEIAAKLQFPEEVVMKPRASVLSTGALYVDYVSGRAHDPGVLTSAAQPSRAPHDIWRGRRFRILRWTAPAGVIAAGLVIWLAVRENNRAERRAIENVEMAQEQPAEQQLRRERSVPLPTVSQPGASAAEAGPQVGAIDKIGNARQAPYGALPAPRGSAGRRAEDTTSAARTGANAAPPPGAASEAVTVSPQRAYSTGEQPRTTRGAATTGDNKITAKRAENSVADGSPTENVRVGTAAPAVEGARKSAAQTPAAPAPNAATSTADAHAQEASAGNDGADFEANKNATAANSKVQGETTAQITSAQAQLSVDRRSVASLETTAAAARTVAAPSGMVLWRLGDKGTIERSTDRGVGWSRQNSGTKEELLSGTAPGDSVCWVVGRGGTILRTVDGGGHWSKLVSPVTGEIGGIRAVDALHATLVDASGQASFATSDGGLTWAEVKK